MAKLPPKSSKHDEPAAVTKIAGTKIAGKKPAARTNSASRATATPAPELPAPAERPAQAASRPRLVEVAAHQAPPAAPATERPKEVPPRPAHEGLSENAQLVAIAEQALQQFAKAMSLQAEVWASLAKSWIDLMGSRRD